MSRRGLVLVDVDATVAEYDGQFIPHVIGRPLAGAREALREIRQRHFLAFFTTRPEADVRAWAAVHEVEFDYYVAKPEVPADADATEDGHRMHVVIDDRAIQYRGSWAEVLAQLANFKPWYRV